MKAKEYRDKFIEIEKEKGTDEAINKIALAFLLESKEVMEKRNIKSDGGFVSLLREFDQKWRALVRLIPDKLNPDGFKYINLEMMPGLEPYWKDIINHSIYEKRKYR